MFKRIHHYNIIEELGRGGMGVVYKAEDTRLHRTVALKLLSNEAAGDPKARERFTREARLASSLQHPNICTVHEINETTDGELFISMDYYEGETLQQTISESILPLDLIFDYAIQIAEGLNAAHKKGIFHRDIKPGNIMITDGGMVKILDFGLAKLADKVDSTQTGKALGTISYLSPEQAKGQKVDHLTDIWSFGVVLYEMTTGILPFTHEYEAAVIYSILDKSPHPPTEINEDLPEKLEVLIYKCLRKDREERYQSADELIREMKEIHRELKENRDTGQQKSIAKKRPAERRLVTIMVAEFVAYHELFKILKEEEADTLITKCLKIVDSNAKKYGGIVISKTNVDFTIVFGISEQGENAPVQALNAGIALRHEIDQLNASEIPESPLKIKAGINSGYVIVRVLNVDGREEYSVTGDTLTFARQLTKVAAEGKILAGPLTFRNTKQLFDFNPRKHPVPTGRDQPVPLYELKSDQIKDIRKTIRLDWLIQSEMVGREKEMDTLQYYLMRLIHGEGFIVNVIGEAGVGKSRLISEFQKKEQIKRVKVLEGRAVSSGENLHFHPLIDLLRDLAGIRESDDMAEATNKLEKSVQQICSSEADEIFPFIATLMGMNLTEKHAKRLRGLEGEGLEKLILKNLRTLMVLASSQKPLLILIEDLHWADQSSIHLLKMLYRLAEDHHILFINVFRPNYHETSEKVLAAIKDRHEKHHTELTLKPLDETQSGHLIKNLLNTKVLHPKIKTLVYGQTEGNPLYTEEVVRSLIHDGIITKEDGQVRITEKIKSMVIPETIQQVLMARIDNLDEETRSLVKIASVIGRSFFRRILQEMAGKTLEIDRILDHLLRIQLITENRRMEEVEYMFKHALIHQAAYNMILASQRKELHLKAGRAIETVFRERIDDFYGILAYHYGLGEDPDRAEEFLIKAGERAIRSSASFEALHYFREALSIYLEQHGQKADPEKIALLHKHIGYAHYNTGHFIETAEYLDKVLRYYRVKVPKNAILMIMSVLYGLVVFLIRIRFPSLLGKRNPTEVDIEINDMITTKVSALTITDSMRFVLETLLYAPRLSRYRFDHLDRLMNIGTIFSFGGVSLSVSSRILAYAKQHFPKDDIKLYGLYRGMRCFHNLVTGQWNEEEYDDELMDKEIKYGDFFNTITHMGMQAHICIEQGDQTAELILDRLDNIADTYEYDYSRLAKYSHGALYFYKFQEFEETLKRANEGLRWVRNILGNKPGQMMIYSMKIRAQIMLGNLTEAEETLQEATDLLQKERLAPYFQSFFLTATLLYQIRRLDEAILDADRKKQAAYKKKVLSTGKKALNICKKVAYEKVETCRLMGIYYWLTLKQHEAMKWWSRAISESESLGANIERALTLREVARRLKQPRSRYQDLNGVSPESMFQQAEILFKEMNIKVK